MVEEGRGFSYLKRRKLSVDRLGVAEEEQRGVESGRSVFSASRSASREEESEGLQPLRLSPTSEDAPEAELPPPHVERQSEPDTALTEPNTPTSSPPSPYNKNTRDKLATKTSFSSLINFDPSSQQASITVGTISRAELLRLRLRVAMYKVRTNQIETPFAKLLPKPSFSEVLHRRPLVGSGGISTATAEAVEEAVAMLKR